MGSPGRCHRHSARRPPSHPSRPPQLGSSGGRLIGSGSLNALRTAASRRSRSSRPAAPGTRSPRRGARGLRRVGRITDVRSCPSLAGASEVGAAPPRCSRRWPGQALRPAVTGAPESRRGDLAHLAVDLRLDQRSAQGQVLVLDLFWTEAGHQQRLCCRAPWRSEQVACSGKDQQAHAALIPAAVSLTATDTAAGFRS